MTNERNAIPVAKSRSWVAWKAGQPWRYTIGFDGQGAACRFDIYGGTECGLALAWRTTDGEWLGRFRYDDGYVTARLSSIDIDLIENSARAVRD